LREGQTDHDWWDYIYEMWGKALTQIGFDEAKISFSGFWSQGDGASFTCDYVDCRRLLQFMTHKVTPSDSIMGTKRKNAWNAEGGEDFSGYIHRKIGSNGEPWEVQYKKLLRYANDLSGKVVRTDSRYVHYNTCDFKVEWCGPEKLDGLVNDWEADVEKLREQLSQAIYKSLEEGHDDQTSEEAISDFAEANDYTFTINGTREG